jgi:predicted RNase H-like HicB family nuclease
MEIEITAHVHYEDGGYWAEVPAAPGLFASADTLDELPAALVEAWVLYHADDETPMSVHVADEAPRQPRVDEMKILVHAA